MKDRNLRKQNLKLSKFSGLFALVLLTGLSILFLSDYLSSEDHLHDHTPLADLSITDLELAVKYKKKYYAPGKVNADSISIKSVKADTGKRKIQTINFSVIGNLYRSMSGRLGRAKAGELSILTARLLEWNLNVRTDLMRGDKAIMLFEKNKQGLSIIALKYFSQKKNRTFNYYRFKSKTSAFPKYFNESGHRTDYVLENSPLKDYDQIIAFLGDGRNHNGIDFKAPILTSTNGPFSLQIIFMGLL